MALTLFLATALCMAVAPSLSLKSTRAPPLTRAMIIRVGPEEAEVDLVGLEEGRRAVARHSGVSR